jgi:hypothetical protein
MKMIGKNHIKKILMKKWKNIFINNQKFDGVFYLQLILFLN